MKTLVDPPVSHWHLGPIPDQDRPVLHRLILQSAELLGSADLSARAPIIATGHQAWLWHPGILAKDLAMVKAAALKGAGALHVVVDQDVHEVLNLELPLRRGRRLESLHVSLGIQEKLVPAAVHPPIDPQAALDALDAVEREHGPDIPVDLTPLRQAWTRLPSVDNLAKQMAIVLYRLMLPYTGPMALLMATDALLLPSFDRFIQILLADPGHARQCILLYNQAVADFPQARLGPLRIDNRRIELPLWFLPWRSQRQRVFLVIDGSQSHLQTEMGQTIDVKAVLPMSPACDNETKGSSSSPHQLGRLAPKAILLTALLRTDACDLFIHGKGGAIYDQITEAWWPRITGHTLAPRVLVSTDLYLDLNVPQAAPEDLARAIWYAHHLPHNLDRQLNIAGEPSNEKRRLLEEMSRIRDRRRRAMIFTRLHQINRQLAQQHPDALFLAGEQVELARDGLANRALAQRRDWCFALYPSSLLHQLTQQLTQ